MNHEIEADLEILNQEPEPVNTPLNQFKILHLNADFRPLSYYPLSCMHWQHAMFLLAKGESSGEPRVQVVDWYEDVYVHHGRGDKRIRLPSVVAHLEYRPPPEQAPLTNDHLFLRDAFTCQYTGECVGTSGKGRLSRDHVIATGLGGPNTWDNTVAATKEINTLKSNMTLREFEKQFGYRLRREPWIPSWGHLYNTGKRFPPKYQHETWRPFLQWDTVDLVD